MGSHKNSTFTVILQKGEQNKSFVNATTVTVQYNGTVVWAYERPSDEIRNRFDFFT